MGEMADDLLDQVEDYENARLGYWNGDVCFDDAVEAGVIDEDGSYYNPGIVRTDKTCRCCKKSGLYWGEYHGNWRLFDGNEVHQCPINPLR